MKILYYDCFAGICGDMHLGAMIDLGVPESHLISELKKLRLSGYHISVEKGLKNGISGTLVKVHLSENNTQEIDSSSNDLKENHHHKEDLEKHGDGHKHNHEHNHHHHHHHEDQHHQNLEHHHRGFTEIKTIIENSSLSTSIKERAVKMFYIIGEAEAKIHNKSIEEIHFHEVGAVDSIVDIVGAAICIEYLNPDLIISSDIELGGGFIEIAHGRFPVPAPATIEILKDVPVKLGATQKEMTTPTGAAIIKANVHEFSLTPSFIIDKTAYGLGQRTTNIPNVLRVILGHTEKTEANFKISTANITECTIDDMNPESFQHIFEQLFKAGASDVTLSPVQMKKNRPGIILQVLHTPELNNSITEILFKETPTIGLRTWSVQKKELQRIIETIETPFGKVRYKKSTLPDGTTRVKPEFEDARNIAIHTGNSIIEILDELKKFYTK